MIVSNPAARSTAVAAGSRRTSSSSGSWSRAWLSRSASADSCSNLSSSARSSSGVKDRLTSATNACSSRAKSGYRCAASAKVRQLLNDKVVKGRPPTISHSDRRASFALLDPDLVRADCSHRLSPFTSLLVEDTPQILTCAPWRARRGTLWGPAHVCGGYSSSLSRTCS